MKFSTLSLVAATLFASVAASQHANLIGRDACNRDNCLRQVVASAFPGGPQRGSTDCASFQTSTVTACPPTVTVTAPAVTVSSTTTSSVTTVITVSTFALTSTTSTTVTTTVTTTTAARKVRRNAPVKAFPGEGALIVYDRRAGTDARLALKQRAVTSATCPVTTKSSAIPSYASSCRSSAQYASACSCNGVSAGSTTLTPATVTVTVTPTSTVPAVSAVPTTVYTTTITGTVTLGSTTTVVTTSTAIVPGGPPRCSDTYRPPPPGTYCGNNVCYYTETACYSVNVNECGDICANDPSCYVAQYANGHCVTYTGCNC